MMRSPRLGIIAGIAIIVVVIAAAIWAFGEVRKEALAEADRERPVETPQRVFTDAGQTILRIDAATLARSGIVVSVVEAGKTATALPIFATVLDTVRLTELANAWAVGSAQAAAARARATASRASLARTQLLYDDAQNASLAQLEAARVAYAADRAGANAAQAQVATTIASARQELGPALVPGSALVAAIVGRRSLLIQVALPAAAGRAPANLQIEDNGGIVTTARLVGDAARADPRVPGRGAYYIVPAASGLVPGMNVTARLETGGATTGIAIPVSAIVNWQGKAWVYRRRTDGAFVRVPISLDAHDAAGNAIVQNLDSGTRIATQGAPLLLSEELRSQTPVESDGA